MKSDLKAAYFKVFSSKAFVSKADKRLISKSRGTSFSTVIGLLFRKELDLL
jgi:hypothetical protein